MSTHRDLDPGRDNAKAVAVGHQTTETPAAQSTEDNSADIGEDPYQVIEPFLHPSLAGGGSSVGGQSAGFRVVPVRVDERKASAQSHFRSGGGTQQARDTSEA